MGLFLFLLGAALILEVINEGKSLTNIIHGYGKTNSKDQKVELIQTTIKELDGLYADLYNEETNEAPSKEELDYINRQIIIRERLIDNLLTKLN